MAENKKKFTLPIVWHNCYDYPPEESRNEKLWVTDGECVFPVVYDKSSGWYNKEEKDYLPFELTWKYWWADLQQTIKECSEFK